MSLNADRFLNFVCFNFKLNIIFGADAAITSTLRRKEIWQRPNKASLLPAADSWNDKKPLGFGHLWWVDPGWMPGAHQSCSITPRPQLDRGEKIKLKARGSR